MVSRISGAALSNSSALSFDVSWPGGQGIVNVVGLTLTGDAALTMYAVDVQLNMAYETPILSADGTYEFSLPPCKIMITIGSGSGTLALSDLAVATVS